VRASTSLKAKQLLVLPLVFTVIGVTDLTSSTARHLGSADVAFLAAGVAISAVLGVARGATIELFPKDGELWQRYRPSSVALWIALIATKLVLIVVAHGAAAAAGGGTNTLLLTLGVSLLGEAALLAARALSTGLPFASDHDQPSDHQSGRARHRRSTRRPLARHDPATTSLHRYQADARVSRPSPASADPPTVTVRHSGSAAAHVATPPGPRKGTKARATPEATSRRLDSRAERTRRETYVSPIAKPKRNSSLPQ
jgi:hypothetical protein